MINVFNMLTIIKVYRPAPFCRANPRNGWNLLDPGMLESDITEVNVRIVTFYHCVHRGFGNSDEIDGNISGGNRGSHDNNTL